VHSWFLRKKYRSRNFSGFRYLKRDFERKNISGDEENVLTFSAAPKIYRPLLRLSFETGRRDFVKAVSFSPRRRPDRAVFFPEENL
jgi:hypothetical protein